MPQESQQPTAYATLQCEICEGPACCAIVRNKTLDIVYEKPVLVCHICCPNPECSCKKCLEALEESQCYQHLEK
jgi:hypothetical protein